MTTLLIIVIYLAFVGLGLPDSVLGSCWPAMREEFGLSVSYQIYISFTITACTFLSSMLSPRIIKKLGTGYVTVISTFLTAIALLGFSLSNKYIFLILLAIPLGFGAGSIDSALNNYVAIHYKASHMSFLHSFYGIGVFISPIIMSIALKNTDWHNGYLYISFVQFGICLITVLSLPLWKRKENREEIKNYKPIKDVIKIKPMRIGLFIFMASCAVEFVCGNWGTSYLVGIRGLSKSFSAFSIGVYYCGMAFGRFVSGLLTKKFDGFRIVQFGFIFVFTGILLLILPIPYYFGIIGLFFISFGNGPVFPNMTNLTPTLYGKENSQSIISLQMGACYVGSTFISSLFGFIAEKFLVIFPYFLMFFFLIIIISFFLLKNSLKKEKIFKNKLT